MWSEGKIRTLAKTKENNVMASYGKGSWKRNFVILTRAHSIAYVLGVGYQQHIAEQEKVPLLPPPASLELDRAMDKQGTGGSLK